jgi:hypothetical protein
VNRRRALDAVAGEHPAGQRRHGALVEAQREASCLRDRHDSFINEADGLPVDLKPQAHEVPIESDRAVHVEAEGDEGLADLS